jgi:two-component system, response regulator YesN
MLKTLLVEDNEQFRKAFKEMLYDSFPKMVVEEAADGKEALEKVDSFCPRLIFMDIRLPDESGLQLTQKIKAKYPEISIVMLTSYDLPEYRKAATAYGASHYLVKGSSDIGQITALVESLSNGSKDSPLKEGN